MICGRSKNWNKHVHCILLQLEFLSEAETMKMFDHKNIVKLLGVCTKEEPAFALMELMIHGRFLLAFSCSLINIMRFWFQFWQLKQGYFHLDLAWMALLSLSWFTGDLKSFLLARRQFANQNCKEVGCDLFRLFWRSDNVEPHLFEVTLLTYARLTYFTWKDCRLVCS